MRPVLSPDAPVLTGFALRCHTGESERGYITAHESRQNEMHSRRFQMVLIYDRGLRMQKKKCIKRNLIALFSGEFMSDGTVILKPEQEIGLSTPENDIDIGISDNYFFLNHFLQNVTMKL